ncbi:phospholipase D family protein [Lysobacter humi (ex Lee et al. 2017)]
MGLGRRLLRWAALGALAVAVLVASGILLADRLTPRAVGARSTALAPAADATAIDREVAPLLLAQPGRTGVLVLPDGLDAFAARALSARKAGRSLDLQYYIWHDDLTGRLLGREVHAAAERGVRVRLLLDDMNAGGLDPLLLALDAHPNIELRLYNPFRNRTGAMRIVEMLQRAGSLNHRMHNKAWIADGRVAVVGGRNIGDEYFAAAQAVNFRDLDLLLFGPAVGQASAVFDAFWNSAAVVPIAALHPPDTSDLVRLVAEAEAQAKGSAARPYLARVDASAAVRDYYRQALAPHWTTGVRVLSDPPTKTVANRDRWLIHALTPLVEHARDKALVISPYFVPGEDGARVLAQAARRGTFVAVATNSLAANDVPAVHVGYSRYRDALLDAGVALYEIRSQPGAPLPALHGSSGASLHTKAITVDDRRGFVGSFNFDPRSIALNTEMGVLFDDPAIARSVRDEFLRLAGPDASYWLHRGRDGGLRWLDRHAAPPVSHDVEPGTGALERARVAAMRVLPIESQL